MQLQSETSSTIQSPKEWSLLTCMAFRFGFAYLVLYSFPGPLVLIPGANGIFGWYGLLWKMAARWTGAHVLHLSPPAHPNLNGSDTLQQYVQNLQIVVLSTAAMLAWSALDRKRREYARLHQWLRLYVRLVLGSALLAFGAAKVIKTQFPDPFLWRLLQPYGDSVPMGLLWTFMGYSRPYNLFTGLVEMAGGALVIVPRLATLGALISFGATANVFMLNVSYGVTVKLYSLNLLLMCGFLLLPELQRMWRVFVLNLPAEPLDAPPLFRRRWMNVTMMAAQLLFLFYCAGAQLNQSYQRSRQSGDLAPRPPLYGIYAVDEFVMNGKTRPPLFTDELRWRRVVFDSFNLIGIEPADGPMERYRGNLNLAARTLTSKQERRAELGQKLAGSVHARYAFARRSPAGR